jgi:glycosyltransferase involved in cell wall biosynthesis
LSESAATWAEKLRGHKTKVVYIPNPVVIAKAKKINLKLKSPVVMCVGALSKYKNIDKVIEAVRLTSASLLLIGDGEEKDNIQLALSTLPNEFCWIRHLDPEELPSYYASADVFCFVPDEQEAFGRVYLEAMASGLPIVASYDHIRRSIVGEQGIFVSPHNIQDIAMGINSAVQIGKIDYSDELKQYALKTVISQIDKGFHDLVK